MDADLSDLGQAIAKALPGAVTDVTVAHQELNITVTRAALIQALKHLRDHPECMFQQLIDVTAVDYPERAERFDVVYHLLSLTKNRRIRVKVPTDEMTPVDSAVDVYATAGWFERETYDMFGVLFSGHPDLRRLLTDYGFDGHPLRKDFPLSGHIELRYDEVEKRIVQEPVTLTQEFRRFDYLSPWEGAIRQILPGDEKAGKA